MVNRLFILGNGFDLSHGLKTDYTDFSEWVLDQDKELFDKISFMINESNNMIVKGQKQLEWSDFERCFHGILQGPWFNDFVEENIQEFLMNTGDPDFTDANWGDLEFEVYDEIISLAELKELFKVWISTKIEPCVNDCNPLYHFRSEDIFFTFNYTTVLETLYDIKSDYVYHIHGDHKGIIVGHNDKFRNFISPEYSDENDDIRVQDTIDSVQKLHSELSKNVNLQISKLRKSNFYRDLKNVDEVHVMGNGYDRYDYKYYIEISKLVKQHCKWSFYPYSDKDKRKLDILLKNMGDIQNQILDPSKFLNKKGI